MSVAGVWLIVVGNAAGNGAGALIADGVGLVGKERDLLGSGLVLDGLLRGALRLRVILLSGLRVRVSGLIAAPRAASRVVPSASLLRESLLGRSRLIRARSLFGRGLRKVRGHLTGSVQVRAALGLHLGLVREPAAGSLVRRNLGRERVVRSRGRIVVRAARRKAGRSVRRLVVVRDRSVRVRRGNEVVSGVRVSLAARENSEARRSLAARENLGQPRNLALVRVLVGPSLALVAARVRALVHVRLVRLGRARLALVLAHPGVDRLVARRVRVRILQERVRVVRAGLLFRAGSRERLQVRSGLSSGSVRRRRRMENRVRERSARMRNRRSGRADGSPSLRAADSRRVGSLGSSLPGSSRRPNLVSNLLVSRVSRAGVSRDLEKLVQEDRQSRLESRTSRRLAGLSRAGSSLRFVSARMKGARARNDEAPLHYCH
jgi:hypothetical protein